MFDVAPLVSIEYVLSVLSSSEAASKQRDEAKGNNREAETSEQLGSPYP